jgi:hypothetical protein
MYFIACILLMSFLYVYICNCKENMSVKIQFKPLSFICFALKNPLITTQYINKHFTYEYSQKRAIHLLDY